MKDETKTEITEQVDSSAKKYCTEHIQTVSMDILTHNQANAADAKSRAAD